MKNLTSSIVLPRPPSTQAVRYPRSHRFTDWCGHACSEAGYHDKAGPDAECWAYEPYSEDWDWFGENYGSPFITVDELMALPGGAN